LNRIVKLILHTPLGAIIVVPDIIGNIFYFTDFTAGPAGSVIGEVFDAVGVVVGAVFETVFVVVDAVFEAVFVFVPFMFCASLVGNHKGIFLMEE
jgi:hypothetical protein